MAKDLESDIYDKGSGGEFYYVVDGTEVQVFKGRCLVIHTTTTDPSPLAEGMLWIRTDL